MAQKKNRRNAIIAALAVLVVALAVGGTIAWLTAQDALTNTFTVGNFSDPDKDPDTDIDDPENPNKDEDQDPSDNPNTGGYLFETNWNIDEETGKPASTNPQLTVGVPEPKNPNVGIGQGSDDAYVFIYVKNKAMTNSADTANVQANAPYFTIEKEWAPVHWDGAYQVLKSTNKTDKDLPTDAYVGGLFEYRNETGSLAVLSAKDADVYTGELFETITIPNGVDTRLFADSANIEVYAFIYGVVNGAKEGEDGSATAAEKAAYEWMQQINAGTITVGSAAK